MTGVADIIVGNRSHIEPGIGFGQVTRAACAVLFLGLNEAMAAENERWKSADLALQEIGMDEGVGQIEIPEVQPRDFHPGPRRSLQDQPPDRFPSVATMAYLTVPSASQFDQFDTSDITLFVECVMTSGPVPDGGEVQHQAIVHRRIERMTEAAALVIASNTTLLGSVNPITRPPRGGIGNQTWLKSQKNGSGPRYMMQGSRLQYTLQRHHASL